MIWLIRFVRSMLGQMIVLSAAFVAGGVYLLATRSSIEQPRVDQADLRDASRTALAGAMRDAVRYGGDATTLSARIDGNAQIQQMQQINPGFRYFALSGDVRVGTAAPRYLTESGVARMIAARRTVRAPALCIRWEQSFRRFTGIDHVGFIDCGYPRYFELHGIAGAIDRPPAGVSRTFAERIWSSSHGFLLSAFGVFAICVTILLVHVVRICRIARLIRPAEGDDGRGELSEHGLPTELLPLVRAINRMTAASAVGERRRRFFLSAAAHEMRTPLTVLRTRLEMLEESEDRSKLIADVRRLTRLVNDLLTLTRIGERPPVLAPVRLFVSCRRAVEGLDPVAMRQGVTLRLRGAIETVVLGDASLIETAVANLVGNAIAVTPPGGLVSVSVSSLGALAVRDEGSGVAPERVPEMFEPFVRLSDSHAGYGLGLAIVRAVADVHGATINVDAAEGRGTGFTIRFVAAPEPVP